MELLLVLIILLVFAVGLYSVRVVDVRVRNMHQANQKTLKSIEAVAQKNLEISRAMSISIRREVDKLDRNAKVRDLALYRQITSSLQVERLTGQGLTVGLRGWAISPDAMLVIFNHIKKHQPKIILELGGGYSTCLMATFIKNSKLKTKIITVDHDKRYLHKTEALTGGGDVEYVFAPLKSYGGYSWYDMKPIDSALKSAGVKCDMILVDGPPQRTNEGARRPLLDKIKGKYLADNYTIFLDDAARDDEIAAVNYWKKVDTRLQSKLIDTEKGLSVLSTSSDVMADMIIF